MERVECKETLEYRDADPDEGLPPWCFRIRLAFGDRTAVDVLAVRSEGRIMIEEVRARTPLSFDDFVALAHWIEGPLEEACRAVDERCAGLPWRETGAGDPAEPPYPDAADGVPGARRARPARPRGTAGRLVVAEAYRAAQQEGADPVLAVMCATGHSRRKALRLIAGARDAGLLSPRHRRRQG